MINNRINNKRIEGLSKWLRNLIRFIVLFSAIGNIGCKKLVEVPPPKTQLVTASVFNSNLTATSALFNIYTLMAGGDSYNLSYSLGEYADELVPSSIDYFYTNSPASNGGSTLIWATFYKYIYQANAIIENVKDNPAITTGAANQIIGECKLLRAYWYFYLVNAYGDVPLITTSDYTVNSRASRAPVTNVYRQMITDLTDAQNLLNTGYVDNSDTTATNPVDKQRPPRAAATAMLARVYLYNQKYDSAEAAATTVISQSTFSLPILDSVFIKNNREAIWQLGVPSGNTYNTPDGYFFNPVTNSGTPKFLSSQLLNSFEMGDLRRQKWVGIYSQANSPDRYYPYKYKVTNVVTPVTEYTMILRLAEQYLIRAEARATQGNLSGAASDLNAIRNRAGLANIDDATASSQTALLAAIQHECQIEFFTEWGHRWFDMKRTGNADAVMSVVCPQKGGQWSSYKLLYPIPYTDILNDNNLVQNPGY